MAALFIQEEIPSENLVLFVENKSYVTIFKNKRF